MKQPNLDALHQSLQHNSQLVGFSGLELLPDKGLAHWHVRVLGSGLLARVPKQSQMGWAPDVNLAYQSACFRAAHHSGAVPTLAGVCPISADLPYGALLVQEISGSAAQLPFDLQAIAKTLASIHCVELQTIQHDDVDRLRKDNSFTGILTEICQHRDQINTALLPTCFFKTLNNGIAELTQQCTADASFPLRLIAYDVHPGNFIVQPNGAAILVDLEKVRISAAGFDLAHATQYTSTTWDIETRTELSIEEILGFYRAWQDSVQPNAMDESTFLLTRKAMWLWAISWCASWLSTSQAQIENEQPNAIKENNEAKLFAHVKERCEHYVSPVGLDRVQNEFEQLKAYWQ